MNTATNKGFTLLEVILSITILSTITLITTQAITRGLRARTKIQAEVDDVSALRDSVRMIRSDINLAFHHRDFEKELVDAAKKPASGTAVVPPAATVENKATRIDPTTNFVGNESVINFVTLNSGRMSSAVKQADFVEVGYELRDCTNLTTKKSSKCLFRRIQNIIDDDVKSGGNEIVMLENVSEFKLRYIGETKQDWVNDWNSTPASQDGGTKGRFPDVVEVSLTIEREFEGKSKTYSMQLVVPIHFPNNASKNSGSQGGNTQGVPGGQVDQ